MTSSHLTLDVAPDGMVAVLTLDRPPRNVLNIEMMEEINAALLTLRERRGLKVLVVRGRGEAFCGGVDLTEHTRDKVARMRQVFHRIFETIRLLDVVSVAAVHGPAVAGGFELAIGCNLVVASDTATFSLPDVRTGLLPPVACVILPRAAPRRKAMEWILLGERIPAGELARYGLVNRVLPAAEFDARLDAFIREITASSGPVLQLARRAQTESYYATYEEALYKVENLYLRDLMALHDSHEGVQAALEQRTPQWRNG